MAELTMPKLSDSMADAVILRWLKAPGEAFQRGEALLEVETDKANVVYEAEDDGTLETILVPEGRSAGVGQPIARLDGGPIAAPSAGAATNAEASTSSLRPESVRVAEPGPGDGAPAAGVRANATPVARKAAVEFGLSLQRVPGSGPGGRITADDVRQAAASLDRARDPASVAAWASRRGHRGRADADAGNDRPPHGESATTSPSSRSPPMSTSPRSSPGARPRARTAPSARPSLNDFVVKAAALALAEFPTSTRPGSTTESSCYSRVNVGIAVATDDALLVPVVLDADRRSLGEIAAETRGCGWRGKRIAGAR